MNLNRIQPGRAEPAKPADRRIAERKRQRLIDGFVSSSRMPPRPCRICDTSSTGSKVELWSDHDKPLRPGERITLYIPADRKEIDGEVVWRKANAMGVRFTSGYRQPTRSYD
jgi:PilZ domain